MSHYSTTAGRVHSSLINVYYVNMHNIHNNHFIITSGRRKDDEYFTVCIQVLVSLHANIKQNACVVDSINISQGYMLNFTRIRTPFYARDRRSLKTMISPLCWFAAWRKNKHRCIECIFMQSVCIVLHKGFSEWFMFGIEYCFSFTERMLKLQYRAIYILRFMIIRFINILSYITDRF